MIRTLLALSALGIVGIAGATNAASPVMELRVAPTTIPVIDEGTAIEEEERPNEVAPGSQSKGEPAGKDAQPKSDGGDVEIDEVEREYPTEKLPPSMEK
ncbi:MAG TPA: hypothetical protein VIG52_09420 [Methyloceanibacter sp.]|jgi:hypothetical protein